MIYGGVTLLVYYSSGIDVRVYTPYGCGIMHWLLYVSGHSTAWLLVAVTFDR